MNRQAIITRIFRRCVDSPKWVVATALILALSALAAVPHLKQDTRSNAFLAPDNPALIYREKIKQQFGLSDPIIVAVRNHSPQGVFNSASLQLVQDLTDQLSDLPNVDAARVVSLATEKNISYKGQDIDIRGFLNPLPQTQAQADSVGAAVDMFPLYLGSLVSADHTVTLIVVELIDELQQESTYADVMDIVSSAPTAQDTDIHVAGEGALAGYLGSYIESDAVRLNPLAWLIISLSIFLAFRHWHPVFVANIILVASVLITLGAMAASGVPFYMITSALPVILIGISVADAIHVYSHFYQLQARHPQQDRRELIVATMVDMARPITLTSLTTIAGFLGLYLAAYMPPFKFFGLFAALGVFVAWLYSMTLLPAAIALGGAGVRPPAPNLDSDTQHLFSRFIAGLGKLAIHHTKLVLGFFLLVCCLGGYSASRLVVDENPINIFHNSEPIFIADQVINQHMEGSNALDVVIETPEIEGLLEPQVLRKIAALQAFAATLPHVGGSASIVDYMKQMNRALTSGTPADYQLPDSKEQVAQYFLVYSAMSDPTDFEEEIDYNYQTANLRIYINSGNYSDFKPVVEALQGYIDTQFNDDSVHATLSGRVTLNYYWIRDLGRSHFAGTLLALLLVGLVSALLLKSVLGGLYALLPVAMAVLLVYAVMAATGLTIGVGTSMFAAVAIGLGVDFSIHTLDRLRALFQRPGADTEAVFAEFFQTTGLTLFVNFMAIACGFGVLISSQVASLNQFGGILVVAISTSFLASLTVVPALVKVFRPGFVVNAGSTSKLGPGSIAMAPLLIGGFAALLALLPAPATAETVAPLTANEIVAKVNAVPDGEYVTQTLSMDTTDRHGQTRSQETINYRKHFGEDKKTILFFLQPSNVRGTGFLIWNYGSAEQQDDQWLYLPALRKVRRVSAADRGDYFLGTDFTYEDMKLEGKFEPADYNFELAGEEELDGVNALKVVGIPKNDEIARELGYSKTVSWVDSGNWMLLKADFYGLKGKLLKTMTASDIAEIDGIWTRHSLMMENHQTGHSTEFTFSDVDYVSPVDDSLFTQQTLARGR